MPNRRRELLGKISRMGPAATVGVNIAVMLFVDFLVIYLHRNFFRLGWMHSTSAYSWEDVLLYALIGTVTGLMEWTDRDKRRRVEDAKRAGVNATMI